MELAFAVSPVGSFCSRTPLRICKRHPKTPFRRKIKACDPSLASGDDGASLFAAADLALLQSRISSLREELVAKDRRIARNWQNADFKTSVVACVPGENFVRRVSIDGSLMACGTADGSVCLFNLDTCDRAIYTNANSGQTTAVALQGAFLASVGSADQTVVVWDVASFRSSRDWAYFTEGTLDGPSLPSPRFRLTGHSNILTAIQIDASSRRLYSASLDGTVRVWCLTTGNHLRTIHVGEPILCMKITSNSYILIGCASGRVQAYQATRGIHLISLQAHPSNCTALSFHDETQMLATGSAGGAIKLWNFNTSQCVGSPPSHNGAVMALQLDETKVVSASRDGTIAMSSIKDAEQIWSRGGYTAFISSLSFDNERLIVDGTNNLITALCFDAV